ncbi:Pycsar system effector family protein [Saccharopolyspora gloriosae]|uniref:Pycsar system effector family protein n=1 Tax=Saccharopolyspora gloriosae TaxID=455344 RepID=UPI001FB859B8|nr:Pycsar system effector family protein [Saccharopolyspora gloriosae]
MHREQLATIDRDDRRCPAPEPNRHVTVARDANSHLTREQELEVALRTAGDFRTSISGADTKAGLLISALGICLGGAGKAMATPPPAVLDGLPKFTSLGLLALLLCGALGALLYLTAVLTPLTRAPSGGPNLFAFPTFPHQREAHVHTATTAELCAQAWLQAETLAHIAGTKYRRLRNALRCFCAALLAFLLWTGLLMFLPVAGS